MATSWCGSPTCPSVGAQRPRAHPAWFATGPRPKVGRVVLTTPGCGRHHRRDEGAAARSRGADASLAPALAARRRMHPQERSYPAMVSPNPPGSGRPAGGGRECNVARGDLSLRGEIDRLHEHRALVACEVDRGHAEDHLAGRREVEGVREAEVGLSEPEQVPVVRCSGSRSAGMWSCQDTMSAARAAMRSSTSACSRRCAPRGRTP